MAETALPHERAEGERRSCPVESEGPVDEHAGRPEVVVRPCDLDAEPARLGTASCRRCWRACARRRPEGPRASGGSPPPRRLSPRERLRAHATLRATRRSRARVPARRSRGARSRSHAHAVRRRPPGSRSSGCACGAWSTSRRRRPRSPRRPRSARGERRLRRSSRRRRRLRRARPRGRRAARGACATGGSAHGGRAPSRTGGAPPARRSRARPAFPRPHRVAPAKPAQPAAPVPRRRLRASPPPCSRTSSERPAA